MGFNYTATIHNLNAARWNVRGSVSFTSFACIYVYKFSNLKDLEYLCP
jgi:hypothetical protein